MNLFNAVCFNLSDLITCGALMFLAGLDAAAVFKIATKNQTKRKGRKQNERL